ncbi:hypothetical protein INT48_003497 [Thamnidium elegans]|uniref:Uncharacterized protein n=1 Tax=Thamnidium elegans TaxID=101142 RepID=A0A8H7SIK6_9FUNG|nr:hypothetical protein INT48_003497 [Thamnidium elegans]
MKTTIILTLASIACLQTVSAAYWTVRYRTAPLQNGKYSSEYEYWGTDLTAVNQDFGRTELACSFTASHENKALLFNKVPKSYFGCGEPDKVPRFSPMISAMGSDTELYALAVQNGMDVPCVLIEYGTGYKTYICSELMPVVNTPSVDKSTPANTHTESSVSATIPASTTTSTTKTTTIKTTTNATKKTTTKTSQPTATNAPCKSGYRGKRNGKGPNGACCSHSDDCLDTCVSGICGVSP